MRACVSCSINCMTTVHVYVCMCTHDINIPNFGKGFGEEAVEFWNRQVSLTLPLSDQGVDNLRE